MRMTLCVARTRTCCRIGKRWSIAWAAASASAPASRCAVAADSSPVGLPDQVQGEIRTSGKFRSRLFFEALPGVRK